MNFPHVPVRFLLVSILTASISISCSVIQPTAPAFNPADLPEELDVCSQLPMFGTLDVKGASQALTLTPDQSLQVLGESGAQDLARSYFSPADTFCGMGVSDQLVTALIEIQDLVDSGQTDQAEQKFDELLDAIHSDQITRVMAGKQAAPSVQAGGDSARKKVRSYMTAAAEAQLWGNDDKADAAMDRARETYSDWASEAVDSATLKETATIAAEAQLLGLDDLSEQAVDRLRELAAEELTEALQAFEPCSADEEDVRSLLGKVAQAQLLGVETENFDFMNKLQEWEAIRKLRENGEPVPACDIWQVDLALDMDWENGSHHFSWLGEFKVLEDDSLEGNGKGTLSTHTQVPCLDVLTGEQYPSTTDVSGTFTFQIQGERVGSGDEAQFKFLFPAEVEFSGVDTCNEFEKDTYLPATVIEMINVFGDPESYDPELDTIFMVLPAKDGASQEYQTFIGPVEVRLSYLGSVGR